MRKSLLVLGVLITSFLASCDKCKDVECDRGSCDEGECICDEGYRGTDCSSERLPSVVYVHAIDFQFEVDYLSEQWDDEVGNEAADVFVGVNEGIESDFTELSNDYKENYRGNGVTFEFDPPLEIEDPERLTRFTVNDLDEPRPQGGFFYETVFWCTIYLYEEDEGFPATKSFTYQEGTSVTWTISYAF